MSTFKELRTRCGEITTGMEMARVLEIRDLIQNAEEQMKLVKAQLQRALIEWINRNGDIEYGTIRLYVGNKTRTKQREQGKLIAQLLMVEAGDIIGVGDKYMASSAFKPGACKSVLPKDIFEQHFLQENIPDLKTGKPSKTLKTLDTNYA